ncbi:MAG: hypothetical protein AAGC69_10110 [Paracraurococcus sp.]|jgi:hypothetical protein
MSNPEPAPTLAAIEAMQGTLAVARALVESGREVDLGGLDGGTAALCAAVTLLPREAGRAMLPALLALLAEVDALRGALQSG